MTLEKTGRVPDTWERVVRTEWLSRLPGPWLWEVVSASFGEMVDVIGLAFSVGRVVPNRAGKAWKAEQDTEQLEQAFRDAKQGRSDLDIKSFFDRVRVMAWTIPRMEVLDQRRNKDVLDLPESSRVTGDTTLEAIIWAYWNQRYPGIQDIPRDSLLAQLVQGWSVLPQDAKEQLRDLLLNRQDK